MKQNEDRTWFPDDRTYRVWDTVGVGESTIVFLVWEVDYHNDPDGGSYVAHATLYASPNAGSPEEAIEQGDSTDVHGSDVPESVLQAIRESIENDQSAEALTGGEDT